MPCVMMPLIIVLAIYGLVCSCVVKEIITQRSDIMQGWVTVLGVICPFLYEIFRLKRVKTLVRFNRVFGPIGYGQIPWEIMTYPCKINWKLLVLEIMKYILRNSMVALIDFI